MSISGQVATTSSSFRALGTAIRTGITFVPQLLRRRWPVYVAIISVAWIIDAILYDANSRYPAVQIAGYPITQIARLTVSQIAINTAIFFILIDTMVLDDPHVKMARGLLWRFSLLTLWRLIILIFLLTLYNIATVIISYGFFHMGADVVNKFLIAFTVAFFAFFAFVYTRIIFTYFAIFPEHRSEISFKTSWLLTGRSVVLPTFTFTVTSLILILLMNTALRHLVVPKISYFTFISANLLYAFVMFPISLQWMHACERINAEAYARATSHQQDLSIDDPRLQ